jgi:hypothetical protein
LEIILKTNNQKFVDFIGFIIAQAYITVNSDLKILFSIRVQAEERILNELCLCVDDGGWFEYIEEFDFLRENAVMENLIYKRIFIITSKLFLVYENNKIVEYKRKI